MSNVDFSANIYQCYICTHTYVHNKMFYLNFHTDPEIHSVPQTLNNVVLVLQSSALL